MKEIIKLATKVCNGQAMEKEFSCEVDAFMEAHPVLQQVIFDEVIAPIIKRMADRYNSGEGCHDPRNIEAFVKADDICRRVAL